jgi:hypothetical protein
MAPIEVAVLDSGSSPITHRVYNRGPDEFFAFTAFEHGLPVNARFTQVARQNQRGWRMIARLKWEIR